ncbi:tetratricopeptide repeat protein [Bizionia myxarmorum]|uniref:Tetratricopeptide repeat protein n=1 Tax=Bizionia myxarmorum TaxID=291186 RepID=A0A5D0RBW0_9FLAO|nr:tetratricopeptide repeat protein [Bizionia myxarmorum]TYB79160.1 tetratricopeptide repeat protein [Bizionia myxarmorum]
MRIFRIVLVSFLLISCKSDEENKFLKKFNPAEHIEQMLKIEKAIELYDEGTEFFKMGDFESAKKSFHKSFDIENSPISLNELGTIEVAKKDYAEAIKYFNQGRKLDPNYWPVYINEARCYEKLTEFKKAEDLLLLLKKQCKSDYWITQADFILALIYFNSRQGCEKVYEFLDKSQSMTTYPELKDPYMNFKNYVETNCE